MAPEEIERQSFAIIRAELGPDLPPPETADIVLRVIHATADFEFARVLQCSPGAVAAGRAALAQGSAVITDTTMALAGINKKSLARHGCTGHCYIADEDVATAALARGTTRSAAAADKAASLYPDGIYVVGNAPTALLRLCELVADGVLRPRLIVGVPVGFVQVEQSKEALMRCAVPWITTVGRKGGSTVAAAICNALVYGLDQSSSIQS